MEENRRRRNHPNVVFLLADQWRGSATGFAGDPNVRTPNLDRLARRSVEFRNAVSVCPVCTPYRAALMTGRCPTSTGMFLNDLYLPASERCMAEMFRAGGYDTAYIGKWHLDGHGRESWIPPERRQGWDFWRGAECDHNYLHSHYYADDSPEKRFWPGYDAFAQTDEALKYLREPVRRDRPFLLMVAYGPPHFPHTELPDSARNLYEPASIQLPPSVPPELRPRSRQEAAGYYAHCELLDRCVGRIVDALDAGGMAEDTILIFTSDHGEMMGSHGCAPFTKQVPWSEASVVPLLIRWPRMHGDAGRVVRTPLNTTDLLPTLMGMAGLRVPGSVEGEDLSRLIRGAPEEDRAALYMLVSPFHGQKAGNGEYRAVRTQTHTYVRCVTGPWLLYDDAADPFQLRNLVAHPAHDSLRAELDARLQTELRKVGDDFHPRQYYLRRFGYEIAPHGSISYAPGAPPQSPRPTRLQR
jgi:arylsulfatase A-like enzyme